MHSRLQGLVRRKSRYWSLIRCDSDDGFIVATHLEACPVQPASSRGHRPGFLYFAESDDRRYIKIGFTANLPLRYRTLLNINTLPCPVRIFGVVPAMKSVENDLRAALVKYAIRNRHDWFRSNREIRAFLITLNPYPINMFLNRSDGYLRRVLGLA